MHNMMTWDFHYHNYWGTPSHQLQRRRNQSSLSGSTATLAGEDKLISSYIYKFTDVADSSWFIQPYSNKINQRCVFTVKHVSFNLALLNRNNQGIFWTSTHPHIIAQSDRKLWSRRMCENEGHVGHQSSAHDGWSDLGVPKLKTGHLTGTIVVVNHWRFGYRNNDYINMLKSRWMECLFFQVSFIRTHLVGQISYTSGAGFGFHRSQTQSL